MLVPALRLRLAGLLASAFGAISVTLSLKNKAFPLKPKAKSFCIFSLLPLIILYS